LSASLTRVNAKKIAVVGGGINGIMSAWALANAGASVTVFETGLLMSQTSRSSTKMLHGGLRYLANFEFAMVRESLQERRWWRSQKTGLVNPIAIVVPIPKSNLLRRVIVGLGVKLYDLLALGSGFPRSRWLGPQALRQRFPGLKVDRLSGGWEYWDAQMDDHGLGLWAANQAKRAGVTILENAHIARITTDGQVTLADLDQQTPRQFDLIVNAAGPWAEQLLDHSAIPHDHGLTLIRGSHLLVGPTPQSGLALPHRDNRLIFFLPYQSQGLLGTTEANQSIDDPIQASADEVNELTECYAEWFEMPITSHEIQGVFSGVRPVVRQMGRSLSAASREAVIETCGRIVTIWGGKWTTSRQLGLSVVKACDAAFAKQSRNEVGL
jgi:glycerol-3-phosphate dehydrogenase